MKEIYNYRVSEDGVVTSPRGANLKWFQNGRGYLITKLKWNGKWMTKALHTVVCEAYHGERPEGYEAGHIDGNASNNCKDNLKWMTKTENRKQMYQDGRDVTGTKNANSKYTDEQIRFVCISLCLGESVTEISRDLSVDRNTVSAIKHRRQWKHISDNFSFWTQGSTTRT